MQLDVNGVKLEIEDHGGGIPVLLVHGYPLSAEIWAPVRPAIEQVARLVTPDLRGFGRSAKPGVGYDLETFASDVVEAADRLGLGRFVLGGHSMGGYVAMAVAARCPERLAGLILIDTRSGADDEDARARRTAAIARVRDGGAADYLDAFVPNLVGATTRRRAPRLVADLRAIAAEADVEALAGCLASMRERPDRTAVLHGLDVPSLVIVGEEDAVTPPVEARALAATLPRATLVLVPEAGHTPSVERPIATANAVVTFLRQFVAAAAGERKR